MIQELKQLTEKTIVDYQQKNAFEHLERTIGHNYTNLSKSMDKLEKKMEDIKDDFVEQGKEIVSMQKDITKNNEVIISNRSIEERYGRQFNIRLSKTESILMKIIFAGGLSGVGGSGLFLLVKALIAK